jgi:hypothetical protein
LWKFHNTEHFTVPKRRATFCWIPGSHLLHPQHKDLPCCGNRFI